MSKRHVDRNHANLRKVLREINTDKHLLVLNEVFGGGDIFCKAFQMDRLYRVNCDDTLRAIRDWI